MKYNHVFEIAYSITTTEADGHKVTADELWAALRARVTGMGHSEILEASNWCPEETVEEDD